MLVGVIAALSCVEKHAAHTCMQSGYPGRKVSSRSNQMASKASTALQEEETVNRAASDALGSVKGP